jgi:hypothetical protein
MIGKERAGMSGRDRRGKDRTNSPKTKTGLLNIPRCKQVGSDDDGWHVEWPGFALRIRVFTFLIYQLRTTNYKLVYCGPTNSCLMSSR